MNNTVVRYIFFGLILFTVIGLIYGNIAAKSQENVLLEDYIKYNQSLKLLEENKQDQTILLLNELLQEHPDDANFYYILGVAESTKKAYDKAAVHFQKAIDLKPSLLNNKAFTFYMGESLYHIGEYELAKEYLALPVSESYQTKKEELLKSLEDMQK